MKQSESIKSLAIALAKAQLQMPVIAFDSTNPFLHNRYASLGAVIEQSRPILGAHGLAISQFPTSDGEMIGIESILMHESGEWISDRILMSVGEEKGKSRAQVVGSVQTYLKRYSWASICGIYADEDTDGTMPSPTTPAKPSQSAPVKPHAPLPTQRPIPKRDAPIATEATRAWMIRGLSGIEEQSWNYFFHKGMLIEGETLEKLPLEFVPTSKADLDKLIAHIKAHVPDDVPGIQEPPGIEEPPANPDAWRTFPLPFPGKKGAIPKGTPLGECEKNYLYGLCMNYAVDTTFNGKPLSEERIAANQKFRDMLDLAKAHYDFK